MFSSENHGLEVLILSKLVIIVGLSFFAIRFPKVENKDILSFKFIKTLFLQNYTFTKYILQK
jgi:hypothetical protein